MGKQRNDNRTPSPPAPASPFAALQSLRGSLPPGAAEPAPAAGSTSCFDTKVVISRERKGRGGKTVSILQGVMSPPAGKEALLKLLKTRLGTGGTLKDELIELVEKNPEVAANVIRAWVGEAA